MLKLDRDASACTGSGNLMCLVVLRCISFSGFAALLLSVSSSCWH